jgi:subtilisin family serine protease
VCRFDLIEIDNFVVDLLGALMTPLGLVKLPDLMELSAGSSDVRVGLIDGPVAVGHSDLAGNIREAPGAAAACAEATSAACVHGTFVAGVLCAKRGSVAPAVCPDCTLVVRPVFAEAATGNLDSPSAEPEELAAAILACIEAGARVINLSLALMQSSPQARQALRQALDYAARRGVLIVAAAGNQGDVGGTTITAHPWVVPVGACDLRGRPLNESNLGHSIGRRGVLAPGEQVTSLGSEGKPLTLGGTSAAAPFVTGAIALIWSLIPTASGAELRLAMLQAHARARTTVTPPLLNAWAVYQILLATTRSRTIHA